MVNGKQTKNSNKYLITAKDLLTIIGSHNINQLVNCFTRVRFHVNDRTIIDDEKIKTLDLVKGINWNGNELQVVIGADAFRVKDEIEKLRKNNTDFVVENSVKKDSKKQSLGQRFIGIANGILIPLIPLFIASGFINGITALLSSPSIGVIKGGLEEGFVTDMDLMSGLMYILSNSGLALLSIFFCYSTVKYFNGNPVMGIFIGLLITSRYFLRDFGADPDSAKWILYQSGDFKISIEAYNNNIIPAVGAGLTYVYLDRFFKKWMPAAIDMVARPVLAVVITFFVSFFLVMPLLGIIVYGLGKATLWLFNWPLGLGGFFVGFSYQPLNTLGLSWPVFYPLEMPWLKWQGGIGPKVPMNGQNMMDASTISLIGVMIALYLKEHDFKKKTEIASLAAPLPFGIVEPTIFGTLIKKPKAFWIANLGSGLIGLLMYNLDVHRWQFGGMGLFGLFGFEDDYRSLILFVLVILIGIILNFVLVYFFYHEKKSELKLVKQSVRRLTNFVWINNHKNFKDDEDIKNVSYFKLHKELNEILQQARVNHQENKAYRKVYLAYHKALNKLLRQQARFETKQTKLTNKIDKVKKTASKQALELKLTNLQTLHQNNQQQTQKVAIAKDKLDLASQNLIALNEETFNNSKQVMDKFLEKYHVGLEQQVKLTNKLWNSINDNLILSHLETPKDDQIEKADYYQTKNKYLLKLLPKTY